jgi:hypothetical protein
MPIKVLGPTHDRHPKNTRRENRLEELGRVDAEKAYTSKGKRNLRDEKHRIRSELKKGGKAKNGLSPAQSHYVQYGYGPHKRDRKAVGGVIKAAKKVAKTVAAPGTHIRNVVSGKRFKDVTTKLIKGLPKTARS